MLTHAILWSMRAQALELDFPDLNPRSPPQLCGLGNVYNFLMSQNHFVNSHDKKVYISQSLCAN